MFHELQIFENPEAILLVASIIFFFSIIAGKAGFRFGLPALLLFLGVGMLFGSDGLGIQFSNPSASGKHRRSKGRSVERPFFGSGISTVNALRCLTFERSEHIHD